METDSEWEVISEPSADHAPSSDDGEWEVIGAHPQSSQPELLAPPIRLSGEQQSVLNQDQPPSEAPSIDYWSRGAAPDVSLKELPGEQLIPWSPPTAKPDDSVLGPPSAALYNTFIKGGYDFLNTPGGALTLGAGVLPKIGQKALALYFGSEMAKAAADKAGEYSVTKDPTTGYEALFSAAPVPLLAKHGAGGVGAAKPFEKFQVEPREFTPAPVEPLTMEGLNAKTIRSDPGQIVEPGNVGKGSEVARSQNLQQPTQGAPDGGVPETGAKPEAKVASEPVPEQLGKFKESSGKVSWTPDYFKAAGENIYSPDWWVDAFDKIATPKYDGTGTSYQIGKFIRELGEEKGNQVIDALEQAREKMSAEIDVVRDNPKAATPEQMAKAMKFGTGAIQLPREAWEAALDTGSAKGELQGQPITRKVANEKTQVPQEPEVLANSDLTIPEKNSFGDEYKDALTKPSELRTVRQNYVVDYVDRFRTVSDQLKNAVASGDEASVASLKTILTGIAKSLSSMKDGKFNYGSVGGRRGSIVSAIKEHKDVNVSAVDHWGMTLPDGYVKSGDVYTYKPSTAVPTQLQTPAAAPATQPSGGTTPPVVPPAAPPGAAPAPAPAPGRGPTTLTDIYRIFEPAPKPKVSLGQRVSNAAEAVRTGVSSKFRPIQKLAEDIAASYGTAKKDVAGIFEQLKGSSGKGEADIYRFDQDVSKLVSGSEKDFSPYMFLRRSLDRLNQDVADVAAGLPERRKVSAYTIPDLQAKLQQLESNLGSDRVAKFQAAADKYQQHMDQALQLQVDSGRMSPAVYAEIKSGNQFYAPFKVMRYIEETSRPAGSGKKIDTVADFTKAMEGIESPDFKLGDMLGAARQNILLSRILAEKNRAMQNITQLAAIDTNGQFITKLKAGQDAPKGMEAVNVLEAGKPVRYAVNPDVAQAIQLFGENGGGIISGFLSKASIPFRAGATALNLPFQVSNLLADVPRQALVSKYGIKGVTDLVRYPLDFAESIFSSMLGDMVGYKNKLYQDFLDSGVAGATIQEHLTPRALRTETPTLAGKVGRNVLYAIPDFAKAIEQVSKIVGVKRAIRMEGVKSGAELAKQIPEAVTELRRFSGSPDFGRQGKWTEQARLNLLYMFLNARIQGAVADLGRLTGRDGAGTAAKTWGKVMTAVGLPTLYAYLNNASQENAEDYAKRPAQEKQNYWLIPKDNDDGTPRYITGQDGEKIRDYWRIPKRESSKWIANMVESAMEFGEKRTPETFGKWAQGMMEDISPVNIQGKSAQERMESVGASLNPLLKAPLEAATGRDMYRHRSIIPDSQKKASPELQYTDRTAEVFKQAAKAMPDVAPDFMRSPLMLENMTKNLTAGLITQFLPSKPVEGRTELENQPLLRRFQAVPYTDSTAFDERMKQYERESADEQLTRYRNSNKLIEDNKTLALPELAKRMIDQYGPDRRLLERIVDLKVADMRGITGDERRVLALPVSQRAQHIVDELGRTPPEMKQETLKNFALKRILTESVAEEMAKLKVQ